MSQISFSFGTPLQAVFVSSHYPGDLGPFLLLFFSKSFPKDSVFFFFRSPPFDDSSFFPFVRRPAWLFPSPTWPLFLCVSLVSGTDFPYPVAPLTLSPFLPLAGVHRRVLAPSGTCYFTISRLFTTSLSSCASPPSGGNPPPSSPPGEFFDFTFDFFSKLVV